MQLSKRAQGTSGVPGGPGADMSQVQQTNKSVESPVNIQNKQRAIIDKEQQDEARQDQALVQQQTGLLSSQMQGLENELSGLAQNLAASTIPELNSILGACIGRNLVKEASLIDEVIVALRQLLTQAKTEKRDTSGHASQLMALVADFGLESQEEAMKEKLAESL